MLSQSNTHKLRKTFNKYGLHLRWPRLWIILLGIILIFLCFCIAGMEVGHTIVDLYRSTAFGGFIIFIPLMVCAVCIVITAFKPRILLLRITVILCCIMIILCFALIVYDILVLIDPTRCFFLSCNYATVDISNSTNSISITGWPLYITWPSYFQTNMNAKRIFQSIQILCACLFILFASLYILTYMIYRNIKLQQHNSYDTNHDKLTTHEKNQRVSHVTYFNSSSPPPTSKYDPHRKVTIYTIEARPYVSMQYPYSPTDEPPTTSSVKIPRKTNRYRVRRANSASYDQFCTRCNQQPRMLLITSYERDEFDPNLCVNCNNEIVNHYRKPAFVQSKTNRIWRP